MIYFKTQDVDLTNFFKVSLDSDRCFDRAWWFCVSEFEPKSWYVKFNVPIGFYFKNEHDATKLRLYL